jgi:hypothetical protein
MPNNGSGVKVKVNQFTGKIIYPVLERNDGQFDINFRCGVRRSEIGREEIFPDIEAHERTTGYDIWVNGKLSAKAQDYGGALETMRAYINSTTGEIKAPDGIEGIVE